MANKNLIWCNPSLFEKDLTGKTYIITGANSGVGFETTQLTEANKRSYVDAFLDRYKGIEQLLSVAHA